MNLQYLNTLGLSELRAEAMRLGVRGNLLEAELEQMKVRFNALELRSLEQGKQIQELLTAAKLNSKNSSLSPSSDRFKTKSLRKPSDKPAGGQEGHEGNTVKRLKATVTITHQPGSCSCGCDLSGSKAERTISRQVIELPIMTPEVVDHLIAVVKCPKCRKNNYGTAAGVPEAPVSYGPRVAAFVTKLIAQDMMPVKRTCEILKTMGIALSQATALNMVDRVADNLDDFLTNAKDVALEAEVAHVDETSMRVKGSNYWAHTFATDAVTIVGLDASRGLGAMERQGLIGNFTGIMVHDCFGSYMKLDEVVHQLCCAHLLRELEFIKEAHKYQWAADLQDLLVEANDSRQQYIENDIPLDQEIMEQYRQRFDQLLVAARAETPPPPPRSKVSGKISKGKANCLIDRLLAYRDWYLLFTTDAKVPFTNNTAERSFRMLKVKSKVSGLFRSEAVAHNFMLIYSYIRTLIQNGKDVLEGLVGAVCGEAFIPATA